MTICKYSQKNCHVTLKLSIVQKKHRSEHYLSLSLSLSLFLSLCFLLRLSLSLSLCFLLRLSLSLSLCFLLRLSLSLSLSLSLPTESDDEGEEESEWGLESLGVCPLPS